MDKESAFKRLNEYNAVIGRHKVICRFKDLAITLSFVMHLIMLVPFIVNTLKIVTHDGEGILNYNYIPFLKKIPEAFPLYSSSIKNYIICAIISLFIVPVLVGAVTILIKNFVKPKNFVLDETKDPLELVNNLKESFGSGNYYYRKSLFVYFAGFMVLFIALNLFGMIKYGGILEQEHMQGMVLKILYGALLFVGYCLISLPILFVYAIFRIVQGPLYRDKSKYWQNYRNERLACIEFAGALKREINAEKKAKEKAEADRIEAEKKQKQEEERKLAAAIAAKIAKEAEEEWQTIENPEENEVKARELADKGSPSACKFTGEKIYSDYLQNSYTNKEKKVITDTLKKYFSVSAAAGDIDSNFLLLTVMSQIETNSSEQWYTRLEQVRGIKKSGGLSEKYLDSCDSLIDGIVKAIDNADKLAEEKKTAVSKPKAYGKAVKPAESDVGKTKIFINGGEPLSGDVMGTIWVDDELLTLHYSEAPIEISVNAGMHHIIIKGGLRGDARVDRDINLGFSDVLTVDMPGFRDDDLIKFQKINRSEYRRALDDCGFTVTRKNL